MTNEEARIIVEQLDNYLSHTCQDYGESDHEAMTIAIKALEQESQTFEWCTGCREYDQEKHCCHRWSKVIRNTVEEMKQPCEDAISRAEALKALDYDIKSFEFKSGVGRHMNEIANLLNTIYEIQSDNIKALPPVQPKPVECEDAISMMDLLNNLHKHFSKGFETDEWWNSTHVLQAVKDCRPELFDLNYVSSVQPKPKVGHWVEYTRVLIPEPINRWEQAWYCSECGYGNQECEDGSAWLEWKYCPNCGARMVEPQESEDKE